MRDMKIHEEKRGDNGWTMSLDLAAAYGGWWREIGTAIERARVSVEAALSIAVPISRH